MVMMMVLVACVGEIKNAQALGRLTVVLDNAERTG